MPLRRELRFAARMAGHITAGDGFPGTSSKGARAWPHAQVRTWCRVDADSSPTCAASRCFSVHALKASMLCTYAPTTPSVFALSNMRHLPSSAPSFTTYGTSSCAENSASWTGIVGGDEGQDMGLLLDVERRIGRTASGSGCVRQPLV